MNQPRIRVAIVEDFPDIRAELSALIADVADLESAGVAGTGEEALIMLPMTRPDVVLMDIGLPGISGVECVRRLKPVLPRTNFMMLTIFEDQDQVHASLKAGATGYLVKGATWDRIRESNRELHAGQSPISSSIARKLIRSMLRPGLNPPAEGQLSLREQEVLRALANGRRYKEIAADFGLSVHTVRTHIHRIYQKLHVQNKAGAAAMFRQIHNGSLSHGD